MKIIEAGYSCYAIKAYNDFKYEFKVSLVKKTTIGFYKRWIRINFANVERRYSHLSKCSECKITTVRNQNKHYDAFKRDRDSSSFYHSVEWKRLYSNFTSDNPFCFKCGRFAKIVYHVIPIKIRYLETKCSKFAKLMYACHNKKPKKN